MAMLMLAMGLFSSVGLASAQEAAGEPVETAYVEGIAYVCENSDRAGSVEFFVASIEAASEGDCRLAFGGEFNFTISTPEDGPVNGGTNDGDGFTEFEVPAPLTFEVTEDASGVSTGLISVVPGDYVSITFIQYVAEVEVQDPGVGLAELQIEHKFCESAERAGETEFFAGGTVEEVDESFGCWFGVGTTFTVTPIDILPVEQVGEAGIDSPLTMTTGPEGYTPLELVLSGVYSVTEDANGATSGEFNVVAGQYVLVTVVDYVAPTGEGDVNLTIHKSECETGVGSDIFESCHDDTLADVSFWVNGVEWTTGEDGTVSGALTEGVIEITEDEASFDEVLGGYVYCSEQNTGLVLFDGDTQDGTVAFEAFADDDIVCDWYNITSATAAPVDNGNDDADDDDNVTQLPTTGAGVTAPDSGSLAFLLLGMMSVVAVAGLSGLRQNRS
jgi:hypothetical protein